MERFTHDGGGQRGGSGRHSRRGQRGQRGQRGRLPCRPARRVTQLFVNAEFVGRFVGKPAWYLVARWLEDRPGECYETGGRSGDEDK